MMDIEDYFMTDKPVKMKGIPGAKRRYAITRDGRVWSYPKKRGVTSEGGWLTPFVNKSGYLQVRVIIKGKTKALYVHKLVAEAYVCNPRNYKCVRFLDGDKLNCNADNLEWISQSLLQRKFQNGDILPSLFPRFASRLTAHTDAIRLAYQQGETREAIAKRYNADVSQISCCLGAIWWDEYRAKQKACNAERRQKWEKESAQRHAALNNVEKDDERES